MAASQADGSTTTSTNESSKPAAKSTPKDALVMGAILREMGISDYEPRVVNQMLEFTYRKDKCQTIQLLLLLFRTQKIVP